MSCLKVRKLISAYLDHQLAGDENDSVGRHLAICRECGARREQLAKLHVALRGAPAARPPAALAMRLRVLASHERARRLNRRGFAGSLRHWGTQVQFLFENLMRPLAVPFAGGLLSALCLFSMLVPRLAFRAAVHGDVPTAFYTQPSLEETNAFLNDDIVVEVTVDERGRIADWTVPSGRKLTQSQERDLVFFSTFTPATLFGKPTSGKLLVSFRKSHIIVRG